MVLNDPTDTSVSTPGFGGFVLQGEEFGAEGFERPELRINRRQLLLYQIKQLLARLLTTAMQRQQLANLGKTEANGLGLRDKGEPLPIRLTIEPVVSLTSLRSGQQANLLIVANGLGIEPEFTGELTDAKVGFCGVLHTITSSPFQSTAMACLTEAANNSYCLPRRGSFLLQTG
jgi:hypothetical protein